MSNKKNKAYLANFDEPWIWLTGLGLALGLIMVSSLLLLISVNGLKVFYPKEISQYNLKNQEIWLGEKVVDKKKSFIADPSNVYERQIFTGNKERFGQMFKYLDIIDISSQTFPKQAMRIERIEFGPAIGMPVAIDYNGTNSLSVSSEDFYKKLNSLINENNKRIKLLKEIEQKEIGAINEKLETIRLKTKVLTSKLQKLSEAQASKKEAYQKKLSHLEETTTSLQSEYDKLAKKAKELRDVSGENSLVINYGKAETLNIPINKILSVYSPNQLNVIEKTGLTIGNLVNFVKDDPREANTEGGIFPAIFGTFVMTLLMSIAVMPFGVVAAIYLREYAKQGVWVRAIRIAVNNLAGVPSIVFGVFGLGFFVYVLGTNIDSLFFSDKLPTPTFGTGGVLWAALTLALMTVPVVIVATEEALASVPRGAREGALALGSSKWQAIQAVVLPAAAPGILTGLILAMARGAGEVAPLMLVGVVKLAPTLPLDGTFPFFHLDRKFMHLGFHIYDLGFQSPDSEAAKPMVFATTLFLIGLVIALNAAAILIRNYLRKKYATSAF